MGTNENYNSKSDSCTQNCGNCSCDSSKKNQNYSQTVSYDQELTERMHGVLGHEDYSLAERVEKKTWRKK